MSNVKINVHIRLDGDVLSYFKEKAKQEGAKYQTLINQYLRAAIVKQRNLEDRLDNIEQRLGMQYFCNCSQTHPQTHFPS